MTISSRRAHQCRECRVDEYEWNRHRLTLVYLRDTNGSSHPATGLVSTKQARLSSVRRLSRITGDFRWQPDPGSEPVWVAREVVNVVFAQGSRMTSAVIGDTNSGGGRQTNSFSRTVYPWGLKILSVTETGELAG